MDQKITAVIVNWNRKDDVIALLDSVASLDCNPSQVVVVDNASTDGSSAAIKAHPLGVNLIENQVNLGGTGGFNTGLHYALTNLEQDYIWLLDNDAKVAPAALSELLDAMRQSPAIAVAGSKILNSQDPRFIVETGARIEWSTASVVPLNRNVININDEFGLFDVEYVAICSALFRVSALMRIGIMDERYFLLWDDMDWGISFLQAGYRVVAVNSSVIFHPPFTEKRSLAVDNYYGIRNPLLTASKRTKGVLRCWALFNICKRACRVYSLAFLERQFYTMKLSKQALSDFLFNQWGKLSLLPEKSEYLEPESISWSSLNGRIIILNSGSADDIEYVINMIASAGAGPVTIDVIIPADRQNLIETANISEIITVDFESKHSLARNFLLYLRLRKTGYTFAVNPSSDRTSPFSYVADRLVRFNRATDRLFIQESHQLWKVVFVLVVSELTAFLLFPFLYLRSLYYSRGHR